MAKAQSYYDWEHSFRSKPKNTLGISENNFRNFLKNWEEENLSIERVEKNIIFILDIETTGLDPYYAMICEIGLCFLELDTGVIEPILNITCQEENKEFSFDSWIFQNSDLDIEDVKNAPFLNEFREELQGFFNMKIPCTAYNQNFDFSFLKARNFQIPTKFWDPMHKLTSILKIRRYNGSYKWPSVQEAYDYFFPKERYVERHRALDDAKHEAKIVYATYLYLKEK
ncbi:MAG: 3'-5' exonuclease [Patescibacteria group bacterium]|nr:3'-5' exonuclease [Patescibacteria group bacterium]